MGFDSVTYSRERHAERMESDPDYREKRRRYAAAQNEKRRLLRAADPDTDAAARAYERSRSARRLKDPGYAESRRTRNRLYAARMLVEHPERVRRAKRIAQQNRRARKLNQFIEEVDPTVVYEMHGGMCGICEEFVSEGSFHVDHVIPLSKGGMHGYVNVQPAHPLCNIRKGNRV